MLIGVSLSEIALYEKVSLLSLEIKYSIVTFKFPGNP